MSALAPWVCCAVVAGKDGLCAGACGSLHANGASVADVCCAVAVGATVLVLCVYALCMLWVLYFWGPVL